MQAGATQAAVPAMALATKRLGCCCWRWPLLLQETTLARLVALAQERRLDPGAVSAALSAAYHAVTREGVLQE